LIDSLGGNSSAVTTAFDGAAIMGQWMPIPENRTVVDLTINGELYELDLEEALIDDVVADMSRYFTLKIGDIIIAGATPHSIEAVIDSSVTATLNGKECLNFKVK
jgi:2-keto-4-pentenoate hydratase/2-oxohepta-3-ene-1,7-dioic acid hydratase in catechol pathway